ncbi:MAG: hypothetical protein JWM37_746 [Candidatus Saccharibacteria bacterium]|nr:hypothetical protein [Candidatus Saccharibacteria bacterium]
MKIKRSLLVGATLASVAVGGIGSVGLVSAATTDSASGTSIVDTIAAKFNLNKADVQAVFDEDRAAREAEREADQKQALADAVKAGKLTQAQSDHITSVLNEIKALRGDTDPHDLSGTVKDQIKTKMDDLRTWADDNNVDEQYIRFGRGGHGGPRDGSSSMSSTSTTN